MYITFFSLIVSAAFVSGTDTNASRQRNAPLYGRLVAEEHLHSTHRDAVHQVKDTALSLRVGFSSVDNIHISANVSKKMYPHSLHADAASIIEPHIIDGYSGDAGSDTNPLSRSLRSSHSEAERGSYKNLQAYK